MPIPVSSSLTISTIITPSSDLSDINLIELIEYVKNIEHRIYQKSQHNEEYFNLLAEYIYKTQKFIKLKQREKYNKIIKRAFHTIKFDLKTNFRD